MIIWWWYWLTPGHSYHYLENLEHVQRVARHQVRLCLFSGPLIFGWVVLSLFLTHTRTIIIGLGLVWPSWPFHGGWHCQSLCRHLPRAHQGPHHDRPDQAICPEGGRTGGEDEECSWEPAWLGGKDEEQIRKSLSYIWGGAEEAFRELDLHARKG